MSAPGALPDVRTAEGRPPVVLVAREGDPAGAIAFAATTADLGWDGTGETPEPAAALAGLVEARLKAHAIDAEVAPSWDGVRATALVPSPADATRIAGVMRDAFMTPTTAEDVVAARKKLVALGQRPLKDRAFARLARCTGEPFALPERAGKDYAELDVARLERWRAGAFGLGRVAVAVTGARGPGESVASAILGGPAWRSGTALAARTTENAVDVVEDTTEPVPTVSLALAMGSSSVAVEAAEALGDPRGALAARLGELELPFRVREVVGAAHPGGGCVGAVLEATRPASPELASRVADAVALVRLEADAHLADVGGARDGRLLARRSGDARTSAERAAWWALVDRSPGKGSAVILALPAKRGTSEPAPTRDALVAALGTATTTWQRPVVEPRSRVEAGQGEAWVLLASPCGTESETEVESGVTALAIAASAEPRATERGITVEPWVVSDGAGILVHGPALPGESAAAHARRLADVAGHRLAAEPLTSPVLVRARAELLQRDARSDGAAMSVLAGALAPHHPSWIVPWGASEPLARSADAAVAVRAQALRGGPLRLAILANVDGAQAEAAVHAADRWVARRSGEARTCRAPAAAEPAVPGTYAAPLRPGATPSAYLAFPFAPGDETARAVAELVATALEDGLLARSLGPLARESSARIVGWPRAPALAIRVAGAQSSLDDAVMQARGLVDALHKNGLAAADLERATIAATRQDLVQRLDPRARLVATWRGDPAARRVGAEDVRAFAQKHLGEETMVVVAARPARPTSP